MIIIDIISYIGLAILVLILSIMAISVVFTIALVILGKRHTDIDDKYNNW